MVNKQLHKPAVVCMNSYAGYQEKPCWVTSETPKRYEIAVEEPTALPPNFTILMPGQRRLVPKSAVKFGQQSKDKDKP